MEHRTELAYWLALIKAPGVGPVAFQKLISKISPKDFFETDHALWQEINFSDRTRQWLASPDWDAVEQDLRWAEGEDCHILSFTDSNYPAILKEISDPPPILYVKGHLHCLNTPQLAIVGSRNASPLGLETAEAFAKQLARSGMGITSGLAMGIDGAAHRGALIAGGPTIAVTGTGLDRVYPTRHQELAERICETGAMLSEFAIGTPPQAEHFPRRNRIISGLSLGVMVVEAALRSGSLITARMALEQGREVFAIPGSIHHTLSKGCNNLLRQGAKLVESAADITEELGFYGSFPPQEAAETGPGNDFPLDKSYKKLLECVGYEPTGIDTVIARSGLTAESVCSMLLVLELHGMVETVAGGLYSQTGKRKNDERKHTRRADVPV
ncbi:MAG: DNA-processing protein DprA [Gammaproteobacteria bacterium]|nr:DNA-processing protein DprA [Gammaproteobacteria bacterium]